MSDEHITSDTLGNAARLLPAHFAQSASVEAVATQSAPAAARPVKLRARGSKETMARVLTALKRSKARSDGSGSSDYSRSTEQVLAAVRYVVLTGIKPLDEGVGGFAFGKTIEIYGLDSCGKTALSVLVGAMARLGEIYEVLDDGTRRKVTEPHEVTFLYLDNENSLDEGDRLMVHNRPVDCIVGECDTVDNIFKDIETVCVQIGKIQQEDLAKARQDSSFVAPIQFIVVVVDTIAGTSTREELQQAWGKADYSRQPKLLREGFRNMIRRLKEFNVCLVCTNQVGDSFAPKARAAARRPSVVHQEADFSAYGGKALRYYAHLRIFLQRLPTPYKLGTGMFPDGFIVHWYTSKNRYRMPFRSGRIVMLFKNALCYSDADWQTARAQAIRELLAYEEVRGRAMTVDEASAIIPIDKPGGFSPVYSLLEHLVYLRLITWSKSGYRVNFAKHGISTDRLIGATAAEEDLNDTLDDDGRAVNIGGRLAWPAFYSYNRDAVDALFKLGVEKMFSQNITAEGSEDSEETDSDSDEI